MEIISIMQIFFIVIRLILSITDKENQIAHLLWVLIHIAVLIYIQI